MEHNFKRNLKSFHGFKALKILMIAAVFTLTSCNDDEVVPATRTMIGEEKTIGNGKISSWISVDRNDNPLEIGLTISAQSFDHNAANQMIDLGLPQLKSKTPFDHIGLDWNQHGHEPEGIYNLPHFDIHFYKITPEERQLITPESEKMELVPDQKFISQDYIALPGGVPGMGKHWVDHTAPELNGATFTTTFLLGSFDGKLNFYEPMITLDFLKTKPDTLINIKQPQAFQKSSYYPGKYKIKYDQAQDAYVISLVNFSAKVASN